MSRRRSKAHVPGRLAAGDHAPTHGAAIRERHAVGTAPSDPRRNAGIDALRGVAILAMIAYHFAFDLRYYRVIAADFEHAPFWLTARALILGSFLVLVGVSVVLADRNAVPWRRHLRRVLAIAGCAILVTLASLAVFRAGFIWFGTLHAIAIASLMAWPLRRRPMPALVLGIAIVIAGLVFAHPAFDGRALGWIGFATHKPFTEDYVPLFPWSGLTLIGIAGGHALVRTPARPVRAAARLPRWVRWLGRHSLGVYLVHQPVLFTLLWLVVGEP